MKMYKLAMAALSVGALGILGGCTVEDDPDYVVTPPSNTTVIERDRPNVNVHSSPPNIIIEKETPPPPNVNINVDPPDVNVRDTNRGSGSTGGF